MDHKHTAYSAHRVVTTSNITHSVLNVRDLRLPCKWKCVTSGDNPHETLSTTRNRSQASCAEILQEVVLNAQVLMPNPDFRHRVPPPVDSNRIKICHLRTRLVRSAPNLTDFLADPHDKLGITPISRRTWRTTHPSVDAGSNGQSVQVGAVHVRFIQ